MDSTTLYSNISASINHMINKILSSIDNSLYSILDNFVFIDPDVLSHSYFINIFGINGSNGILLLANSLILGYLIYYGFKLLFANLGITQVEQPSHFIFKLIICSITMNFSLFICDQIINLNSIITSSIRILGENLFNDEISFSSLILKLNSIISINSESFDFFSLDGIIKLIISFNLLNLVITYSVRYVLIKVFVIISPFAFLSLCNKTTSILFKAWLKSFITLLLVQNFIAIVLLLIFSLKISTQKLFSEFILIGALYILIKANNYVREMLGGISTEANIGINSIKSLFKK